MESFDDRLYRHKNYETASTNAQDALDIIIKHLLGTEWYINKSMNQEQINTKAVYEILRRYPEHKHLTVLQYLDYKTGHYPK